MNETNKENLISLIRFIHYCLIFFVLVAPFINNTCIKINISILTYLIFKWITGDKRCIITELEYKYNDIVLNKKKYGFIYRLLNKVILLDDENKVDDWLLIFCIFWLIINMIIFKNNDK